MTIEMKKKKALNTDIIIGEAKIEKIQFNNYHRM